LYPVLTLPYNPANEPQKLTLKVLATDVIVILSAEPARLPLLYVGGHSALSNGSDTSAHTGAGWAWRDMQMDVSCGWSFGRPGIGCLYRLGLLCVYFRQILLFSGVTSTTKLPLSTVVRLLSVHCL